MKTCDRAEQAVTAETNTAVVSLRFKFQIYFCLCNWI